MIKAVIFDCFGVVVGQGFEYTYRLAGGDPKKDRNFINKTLRSANFGQISRREFTLQLCDRLGISEEEWKAAVAKSEQPNIDLLNYIKQLRKKYKTAILSNANKGTLKSNFGYYNLSDYFDDIIASAEVGLIKPDSKIFTLAADRLGVSTKECVFIDDNETNVVSAKQTGMSSIKYAAADSVEELKSQLSNYLS